MRAFIEIFKRKLATYPKIKPLGRWNLDYCDKKINRKIDMSNEDHCGPCGQYNIPKMDDIPSAKENIK